VTSRCRYHQATDTERVGDDNHKGRRPPTDDQPLAERRFYEGVCDEGDGLSGVAKGAEKSGEATVTRHPPQRKFLGRRLGHYGQTAQLRCWRGTRGTPVRGP
jgi:hypothetical protein